METKGYEDESEINATEPLQPAVELPTNGEELKDLAADGVYATSHSRLFGAHVSILDAANRQRPAQEDNQQ